MSHQELIRLNESREPPTDPVTALNITLTLMQGDGLVAKDCNILGQWTTSDPYASVSLFPQGLQGPQIHLGKTETIRYTLKPKWNETFQMEVSDHLMTDDAQFQVTIMDWDEDLLAGMVQGDDDLMGVVPVNIPPNLYSQNRTSHSTKWYGVPKMSASRASGRLQCSLEIVKEIKNFEDILPPFVKRPSGKPILDQATHIPDEKEQNSMSSLFGNSTGKRASGSSKGGSNPDFTATGMKKSNSKLNLFGMGKTNKKEEGNNKQKVLAGRGSLTRGSSVRCRPIGSMTELVDPNEVIAAKPRTEESGQQENQLSQILAKRNLHRNNSNNDLQELEQQVELEKQAETKEQVDDEGTKFNSSIGKPNLPSQQKENTPEANAEEETPPEEEKSPELTKAEVYAQATQLSNVGRRGGRRPRGSVRGSQRSTRTDNTRTLGEAPLRRANTVGGETSAAKLAVLRQNSHDGSVPSPLPTSSRNKKASMDQAPGADLSPKPVVAGQNSSDANVRSRSNGNDDNARSVQCKSPMRTSSRNRKASMDQTPGVYISPKAAVVSKDDNARSGSKSPMRTSSRNRKASKDQTGSGADLSPKRGSRSSSAPKAPVRSSSSRKLNPEGSDPLADVATAGSASPRVPSLKAARKASSEHTGVTPDKGNPLASSTPKRPGMSRSSSKRSMRSLKSPDMGTVPGPDETAAPRRAAPARVPSMKATQKASMEHTGPAPDNSNIEGASTPARGLLRSPSKRSIRNLNVPDNSNNPEGPSTARGGRPGMSRSSSKRSMRSLNVPDNSNAEEPGSTPARGGRPGMLRSSSKRSMRSLNVPDNRNPEEPSSLAPARGGRPGLMRSPSKRSMRSLKSLDNVDPPSAPSTPQHQQPKTSMDMKGSTRQDSASVRSSSRSVDESPELENKAGFFVDGDGVQYYVDADGVEYYQDPADGEWYADEPAPAAPPQSLDPADESGFYEDANGVEYFVDKHGSEHYKEDIPDDADFGFFEDEDGVEYFVDEDGVEHYKNGSPEIPQTTTPVSIQPELLPKPEDESGFYEDVKGVGYYLDKEGIEYYQDPADGEWYSEDGLRLQSVQSRVPLSSNKDSMSLLVKESSDHKQKKARAGH